jgi:hypothetical protein
MVSLQELGEGGALVSGFQRDLAENEEGAMAILTVGFWSLGRRREELAASSSCYTRRLMVGLPGGSLAGARAKQRCGSSV